MNKCGFDGFVKRQGGLLRHRRGWDRIRFKRQVRKSCLVGIKAPAQQS
jgi:hypothetical protein